MKENSITVSEVEIRENTINYHYRVAGKWKRFFSQEPFWIEYSEDISSVPNSVAVIPLLCNILPMAWISDAEIIIGEIDKEFYDSIQDFKHGYMQMYPRVDFRGSITVKKVVDNAYEPAEQTAAFFSGGVDASSTLVSHAGEKMTLITVWGSDVMFDDVEGWNVVKDGALRTGKVFGMKNLFIKSCFRRFLNERALSDAVFPQARDLWWHGFQHGIGLIGHAAPYTYKHKLKCLYIGSTYTEKDKGQITCASDPSIDNYVRLSSCRVSHDGYQYTRQSKIHNICSYRALHDKPIQLRVCWISRGGKNCCACEKCYRTIYGIIAEGFSPHEFGFYYDEKMFAKIERRLKRKIQFDDAILPLWRDIRVFCITSIFKKQRDIIRRKMLRQVLKNAIQLSAIKPGGTAAKKGQTTPVIA